jgi:peptidoglycan/LPS O-acetylase OafA/YrhL
VQKGATSWNYQQFIQETPKLAADYARISHFLWGILLGISMMIFIIRAFGRKGKAVRVWIPTYVCILLYAVWFSLGGTDTYDYKKALFPMVMSYLPICHLAFQYVFKEV